MLITAVVRYRLPANIGRRECWDHYQRIASDFLHVKGLISKHFLWSERGTAGGVYQWKNLESAIDFYQGPWLDGIIARYGTYPDIEYFVTVAVIENPSATVTVTAPSD